MSSVLDMVLQWGSTIKVSTELPVATRHRRDMTEKLLKATLNPNTHTQMVKQGIYKNGLCICILTAVWIFLHLYIKNLTLIITVMILSFQTDMPGQTVQTQIRSSLIRVYTVCHSVYIIWTHYSMVEPHSSNFRVITTIFVGVRIFRKFTVLQITGIKL